VTTRAIYSLFSGLPELVAVLCDRASEAMARHHEAVPVTDNPLGEIVPLALAYRAAALEQADLYDLIFAPPSAQTPASEYPAGIQRSVGRVEDSIRRAIAVGQLAPVEDRVHFRGLWALVHGLTSLELRGALGLPKECEGIWRDAVSTYVRGIAPGLPREA
jgi:AcrR family transcriptional regulator